MRNVYSVEQCRAADVAAQQSVSEAVLIDRASTAVARRAAAMLGSVYGAHVVILAGSGHNGADALWAGVKLRSRGARVDVVLAAEPSDEHGAEPLRLLLASGARNVAPEVMPGCDLVVDGLVGLGFTGTLRDPGLAAAASAAPLVLAVDVPSGVDADTGAVTGTAVRADVTVTFGGFKPGLLVDPGAEYAGQVEVAGVGLSAHLPQPTARMLDADDISSAFHEPARNSSKYTRGVVGVLAGSERYTGAAVLACAAAVRTGAGMVTLFADPAVLAVVRASWPEVVAVPAEQDRLADPGKIDAWVVGPGMGTGDDARARLRTVLETGLPAVLDADAITLAASDTAILRRTAPTVVTPHLGEFERLTGLAAGAASADRLGAARRAAADLGVTVLLKGTTTVVAEPDRTTYINPTGTPWLATAGTGDVLSGMIGTLLASGLAPGYAAATAAWLHGLAGRTAAASGEGASGPIGAGDVLNSVPAAIRAAL